MVEHPGLLLGQDNNTPRAVSEPLEHLYRSSERPGRSGLPVIRPSLSFRMLVPHADTAHSPVSPLHQRR
ncbi:ATPase AAA-2 domain protein [Carbonactinospora thermoautotrophica]|uniref:ATPase AAA-2 domain protein n=1 Tax=Carbonactinospora thermoautotrophica TaxID=1469144 RepID=A0A132MM42_9ACTN|nr:ATPase AAA-2 domain protein [Carbonactinospora thermoautotrophica]